MTTDEKINIESRLDVIVASENVTFLVTPYNDYGQYAMGYLACKYGLKLIALDNYKLGENVISYAAAGKRTFDSDTVVLMASKYSDIRAVLYQDICNCGLGGARIIDLFAAEELVQKGEPGKKRTFFKRTKATVGRWLLESIVKDADRFFIFASGGLGDTLAIAAYLGYARRLYGAKRIILVCKKGYGDIARMFDSIDGCICLSRKKMALIKKSGCQYGKNFIIGYVPAGAVYLYQRRTELYLRHILQIPVESMPDSVSKRFLLQVDDQEKQKWKKAIILAPYANTFALLPERFWEKIVVQLQGKGYDVYTNTVGEEPEIYGTTRLHLSIREMFSVCSYCKGLISYRSGFSDIMAFQKNLRHIVINPGVWEQEYNDVSVFGSERIVNLLWDNQEKAILEEIARWFLPIHDPEQRILAWMTDAQSEEIYSARIMFRDTFEYRFVQSYLDKYLPEYRDRKWLFLSDELKEILSRYEKVVIAGAGQRGKALAVMLVEEGYQVETMIDNGLEAFFERIDVPIRKPEMAHYDKALVIVSPSSGVASEAIQRQLLGIGIASEDIILLNDYVCAAESLDEKQYFDEDILNWEPEEVFIDCGVYDLGTSIRFAENCRATGVERITVHAFEPDRENYRICDDKKAELEKQGVSVTLYPFGVWSENGRLQFEAGGGAGSKITYNQDNADTIDVVTLDSVIHEKVTFIKMDIEGAELEALKGAQNLIRTYHPKLAICIYHKPEDLTEIPLFIKKLVPDYKLYVRHYSNNTGELVLYAV